CRPVDVMEDWARQSSPCQRTKIFDVVAPIDVHGLLHPQRGSRRRSPQPAEGHRGRHSVDAQIEVAKSMVGKPQPRKSCGAQDAPMSQIFTQANLAHGSFALSRRVHATSGYPPKLTVKADMVNRRPWAKCSIRSIASSGSRTRRIRRRSEIW